MSIVRRLVTTTPGGVDAALLLLRLGAGGMFAIGHGLPKAMKYSQLKSGFPDPLGMGSQLSLTAAIFGELVCGTLIALGLFTRLACLPAMFTMFIGFAVIHRGGPWFLPGEGAKEPAIVYFVMFAAIFIAGPGRWSLDRMLLGRKGASR